MKTALAGLALAGALALPAGATAGAPATTIPQIVKLTISTFDRKLKFAGSEWTITSVRCLRETASAYYCRGWFTPRPGSVLGRVIIAWDVSVRSDGTVSWVKE